MGFLRHGRKHVEVQPEHKWDFITLKDFRCTSWTRPFAYAYLWLTILVSISVYAVDTFTAISILAFHRFFPTFEDELHIISRLAAQWIFTICIVLSFLNLAYEYARAYKIMKRGSVAECYLDNIAVRVESIRQGKGQGWRRFLVFAELTKSKKGSEYVALFTYFSFQRWIRVLLCSGPRQFVNAMFLYTYATTEFMIKSKDSFGTHLGSIFSKINAIAANDARHAIILSGMLFTLVVWIFSFMSLVLAVIFFVFYLWYRIPKADGSLSGFCERKINKRLTKIVMTKVNRAIEKGELERLHVQMKQGKLSAGSSRSSPYGNSDIKLPEALKVPPRLRTEPSIPSFVSQESLEMKPIEQRSAWPVGSGPGGHPKPALSPSGVGLVGAAESMGYRFESAPRMAPAPRRFMSPPTMSRGAPGRQFPQQRGPYGPPQQQQQQQQPSRGQGRVQQLPGPYRRPRPPGPRIPRPYG